MPQAIRIRLSEVFKGHLGLVWLWEPHKEHVLGRRFRPCGAPSSASWFSSNSMSCPGWLPLEAAEPSGGLAWLGGATLTSMPPALAVTLATPGGPSTPPCDRPASMNASVRYAFAAGSPALTAMSHSFTGTLTTRQPRACSRRSRRRVAPLGTARSARASHTKCDGPSTSTATISPVGSRTAMSMLKKPSSVLCSIAASVHPGSVRMASNTCVCACDVLVLRTPCSHASFAAMVSGCERGSAFLWPSSHRTT
eukprot:354237-Chlamydomonas_euryale.AAC.9